MFRIVTTRSLRRLKNRATAETIKRKASDNTAAKLLDLRDAVQKEMLIAGMPPDASIRDLIRWHREQASDRRSEAHAASTTADTASS